MTVLDMKLRIWWWGSINAGALGNAEYSFIAIAPWSIFWPGVVAPDRVLSMGEIELRCILMQNLIVWNRIFWHLNCTYVKLNCLNKTELLEIELFWHLNWVLMLNWIVWNGTVFDIETVLMLN